MNQGKNFKIIGLRPSRIGDIITSLPILTLLERLYPNSYKTVSIAKKCSVCVPLLYNYPLIDRLHLNEILERPNKEDFDFFNSHDLVIRPDLMHKEYDWYNKYHMVYENARMMSLDKEWDKYLTEDEKIPKLVPWFDVKRNKNTISVWPVANSGVDLKRGPSLIWWNHFVDLIFQRTNLNIMQLGHPNDFQIQCNSLYNNRLYILNNLEFLEQIKISLSSDLCVSLDSGSGLIMGAYKMRQITLLTNWWENHHSNFMALEPLNINNYTFFEENSCDNIDIEKVFDKIKEIIYG